MREPSRAVLRPRMLWRNFEVREVEWQRVLRDTATGSQPTSRERPGAFNPVDEDFVKAVAFLVTNLFASTVADRLMPISPFF